MKKAFIFTGDGLFAMAMVILIMSTFITYYRIADEYSRASEIIDNNVSDTAMVAFYLGKDAADYGGTEEEIDAGWRYASCSQYFMIEFDDPASWDEASWTEPLKKSFCVGGGG